MALDRLSLADGMSVVIGGATGFGRTLSLGLEEPGAHVIASSRRQGQVDSVTAEVAALRRRTLRLPCDVAQGTSLETHRTDVLANFGGVDIPINPRRHNQKRVSAVPADPREMQRASMGLRDPLQGPGERSELYGQHDSEKEPMSLKIQPKEHCRFDLIALGEIMLRLDPGDLRIATARTFRAWEGGGEYNVARGLKRCFGLNTAVITALADNPVGRLIQDLIYQGGVDQSYVRFVPYDGIGRTVRNGLNFTERGFGIRGAVGCSDRGHTAASQIRPGDLDWERIFGRDGARWFHTGGIFAALSESSAAVAEEAMKAAKRHGAVISYDLNYRESLWKGIGGKDLAREVNRTLARYVDVMIGNEEDFTAALGFDVEGADPGFSKLEASSYQKMIEAALKVYPNWSVVATTLRHAKTASRNDWGALLWHGGRIYKAPTRADLEIFDRVGGGDSFASGLIYGFLSGRDPQWAVECGAAHGALAMTTPGDATMATLAEVEKAMKGLGTRVER